MPPLALAAAAGLHLLVAVTALAAFERGPIIEEIRAVEIELAAETAPAPPQPDARQEAQPPAQTQAQPEPPAQAESQVPPEPPPPEPQAQAAPEPPPIDASIIPLPEPPPPVAFETPKVVPPKPMPPRPAPPKAAPPKPAPAIAAPSPLPPGPAAQPSPAPSAAARPPTHDPRYIDRLAAAIERERDYPTTSRRRGEQGRVVLTLVIAADGRLLSSDIVTGSGFEALDRAALGMVRRARLPAMAPGFGAENATFTIPIVFAIR